jgi:hypothetical protein
MLVPPIRDPSSEGILAQGLMHDVQGGRAHDGILAGETQQVDASNLGRSVMLG